MHRVLSGGRACSRDDSRLWGPALQVQTLGSGDAGHSEPGPKAGPAGSYPPPAVKSAELRIPTSGQAALFQPVPPPSSRPRTGPRIPSLSPLPGPTDSNTLAFRPIHRRSWCRYRTKPGAAARRDRRNSNTRGKCSTQRPRTTCQQAAATKRRAAGPAPGGVAMAGGPHPRSRTFVFLPLARLPASS